MTPAELATELKRQAWEQGFELAGIAPAGRPDTLAFFQHWVKSGYHGEMEYISLRQDAYAHPAGVLPDVRSLLMVGMNYDPGGGAVPAGSAANSAVATKSPGKIARYAQGTVDYHDLLRKRLKVLVRWLQETVPGSHARAVVDTAPLLERDFARTAGLGWFGKNTLLINRQRGSYFFLAGILTDLELPADLPHETSHCGSCTRCLDACPTGAFPEPYVLDARKCLAYLTIELRDQPIPSVLHESLGDWLFGCDVCQEVCPWNRKSPQSQEPLLRSPSDRPRDATNFLLLSEAEFRQQYQGTPLYRTGRAALARNAVIVLGNTGDPQWVPLLLCCLEDAAPLVREAAVRSLRRIGGDKILQVLREKMAAEADSLVRSALIEVLASS